MTDMGVVHGSVKQAVPLVIGVDTVYVHTDIQKTTETDPDTGKTRTEYSYHEVQYDKDEYILLMAQQNEKLEEQITDTQLALCEAYEMMMGGV